MIKKLSVCVLVLVFACAVFAYSDNPIYSDKEKLIFGLSYNPYAGFPVARDKDIFAAAAGVHGEAAFSLPFLSFTSITAGLTYQLSPVRAETVMSTALFGGGLAFEFLLGNKLVLHASGEGGYGYNNVHKSEGIGGWAPYFSVGGGAGFLLKPSLSLWVEGAYTNLYQLQQSAAVSLGLKHYLTKRRIKAVQIEAINFDPVLPSFFRIYENGAIGSLSFLNKESIPIEEVKIECSLEGLMKKPRICGELVSVGAGETASVPLYADFEEVSPDFQIRKEIPATIEVEYKYKSFKYRQRFESSAFIEPVNAFRWEDPETIILFAGSGRPEYQALASEVQSVLEGKIPRVISDDWLKGMSAFSVLRGFGMNYREDLMTPYKEYVSDPAVIDSIQYPWETLENHIGDSVELSLLYCGLLDAAGLETALLLLSEGVLCAFKPVFTEEKEGGLSKSDLFPVIEEELWVPVDMRYMEESFLTAVLNGIEAWPENPENTETFYLYRDLRRRYPQTEIPAEPVEIVIQDSALEETFSSSLAEYIDWEIEPRIAVIEEQIAEEGETLYLQNMLGVEYAKYGKYDEALNYFYQVTLDSEYLPSLVNAGHVYYLQDELEIAASYYERAYNIDSLNPEILLATAKVNQKRENYGNAREAYSKLESIDPKLAERFSYLQLQGEEALMEAMKNKDRDVVVWMEN